MKTSLRFKITKFFSSRMKPIIPFDPIDFQIRRLKQLFWIAEFTLTISIISSFSTVPFPETIAKFSTAIFLLLVYYFIYLRKVILARGLLLLVLTMGFSIFIWIDSGIRDTGLIAFSGILICAAALGANRLFAIILAYTIAFIMAMGYANITGLYIHNIRKLDYTIILDTILIYSTIGAIIWFLIHDLNESLVKATAEAAKANRSTLLVEHMVNHDLLTGLPNKILARDRFEQGYLHTKANQGKIALIVLDLDNFQTINDSLGHSIGDELILRVAHRLSGIMRETDTIARLGADEFLIIVDSKNDLDIVFEVAIDIMNQMTIPFRLKSIDYVTTCSLGIAISPDDDIEFDSLLKKANLALDRAKATTKNRFVFYDTKMNVDTQEQLNLLLHLRTAILENQFYLCYQPKINLSDNSLIGAEALIRWKHPQKGIISPLSFIPITETFGLIIDIGDWVLKEACKQCKAWHDLGYKNLTVAVNVSAIQFKRGNIEEIVLNALRDSGLPPQYLEIEMTESILIDDSNVLLDALLRLRNLGIKFSIDDFGTGYSNLGYIKKFQVEILKIDQSFIKKMSENIQDEAIVKAIIQMASGMGLRTIAEGVEDEATKEKLKEFNCDFAQGYLWSQPVSTDEMIRYIQKFPV
ncbi:putative bifunctional diguanylate cyclase/phosphodiesterase [Leptospira ognonensis]|nr:bifunctional diguanylate cyclase/phosphodiesterase [Leptospira ognonensis]